MREDLSFSPTTPLTRTKQQPVHSPQRLWCCCAVCCHLVFSSFDEANPVRSSDLSLWHFSMPDNSPVWAEPPSPVQHHVDHHHTSTPSIDQFFTDDATEENFPTAPLDDEFWAEDQIPDRHLCIHDTSQVTHLCHYPCPYANLNFEMDLPPLPTPEAAEFGYGIVDLSDADLKDIMQPPVTRTFQTLRISLIPWIVPNLKHGLHKNILFDSNQAKLIQNCIIYMLITIHPTW